MATRTQKTKVALFLGASLALCAWGIVVITGLNKGTATTYRVEFDKSVLGLNEGGVVEYLGVTVGKVQQIRVTPNQTVEIFIAVQDDHVTLYPGVEASLVIYSLATGILYVELSGGVPGPDNEKLPEYALIPTKPSLVESVTVQLDEIMKDIQVISEGLAKGLEGMEEGQLTRMLENADSVLSDGREFLAEAKDTLKSVHGDLETSMDQIHETTGDLRDLVQNTNKLVVSVRDKTDAVDIESMQADLVGALDEFRELAGRLNTAAGTAEHFIESMEYNAEDLEFTFRESMTALRETLEAVRVLADYVKQNPSALVFGEGKAKGGKR